MIDVVGLGMVQHPNFFEHRVRVMIAVKTSQALPSLKA
jgi:hypothetical protein